MSDLEGFIGAAAALHESKLFRSAKSLLDEADRRFGDQMRRADINSLKAAVKKSLGLPYPSIPNGFYALTTFDGVGIVVPIRAEEGLSSNPCCDQEAERAWSTSQILVREMTKRTGTTTKGIRPLHPRIPAPIQLEGASIGLPSALAIRSRIAGMKPVRPVLATGMVTDTGIIEHVGQTDTKIRSALAEIEGTTAFIMVPTDVDQSAYPAGAVQRVHNIEAAVRIAFQEPPRPSMTNRSGRRFPPLWLILPFILLLVAVAAAIPSIALVFVLVFDWRPIAQEMETEIEESRADPPSDDRGWGKETVTFAFKQMNLHLERCEEEEYFSMYSDELIRFYGAIPCKKEKVRSGKRTDWFSGKCHKGNSTRHFNGAIQFISFSPTKATIAVCPKDRWKNPVCLDENKEPMTKFGKIICFTRNESGWKVNCEFTLKGRISGMLDELNNLEVDQDAWIPLWE